MRTAVALAAAGAIAFVPAFMLATPALATSSVLTVSNVSAVEGQDMVFSVAYTGSTPAVYDITTMDGTTPGAMAQVGKDFTALPTTQLTFSGASTQTVTIHTIDDALYENSETFTVKAVNHNDPTDSTTGTGTILDNDTAPTYTLSASPSPVPEDVAGGNVTITATLSAPSGVDTTIGITTTNGTAVAGKNFTGTGITPILITAGQTSGTTTIPIINDMKHDATSPMTFTVNGLGDNVTGKSQTTTVNISDVQPMPKVTISSPGATVEGNTATWTVSTDTASTQDITVEWDALATTPATGHGTATPGVDFTYPSNGRVATIPAGSMSTTISIPITDDALNELTEDYTIGISNPVNAVIGTAYKAVGSITDNDTAPTVSVTPTAVPEGDSGKKAQTFTATLSAASGRTVTVEWSTVDDTAKAGYDYVQSSGELVFPAGTTTQTFSVPIIGDTIYENPSEDFYIHLALPDGENPASFTTGADTMITITDDDPQPTVTVNDMSVKEGDTTAAVLMPITLSNPTNATVVVTLTPSTVGLTNGASSVLSATIGSGDYSLLNSTVTIPAGQTTGYAVVLVNGDKIYEPDESVNFGWSATNVAAPTTGTAKFTILNDDNPPNLEINSVRGNEGDTVNITGTVTGQSQAGATGTIWFTGQAEHGATAADNTDFTNPGVIPFTIPSTTPPGSVIPLTTLTLTNDDKPEPEKTILVSGTGVGNQATVTDGVVTINPSDGWSNPAPTIMAPASVNGAAKAKITGMAQPYATVELWGAEMSAANGDLSKLDTTSASSTGAYSFTTAEALMQGWRFQVKSGGKLSSIVTTKVSQMPTLTVSTTKGKLSLSVMGNPGAAKQSVTVQRQSGSKWITTWTGTTGSDKMWKATVSEKSKSTWTLRAYVGGSASTGINGGYSATKKVTIK